MRCSKVGLPTDSFEEREMPWRLRPYYDSKNSYQLLTAIAIVDAAEIVGC